MCQRLTTIYVWLPADDLSYGTLMALLRVLVVLSASSVPVHDVHPVFFLPLNVLRTLCADLLLRTLQYSEHFKDYKLKLTSVLLYIIASDLYHNCIIVLYT